MRILKRDSRMTTFLAESLPEDNYTDEQVGEDLGRRG